MREVENILRILKRTVQLIKEDNPYEIRFLSDQTIHSATVSQDSDNIIVAVLIYSIGKILERENYRKMKGWEEFNSLLRKNLELCVRHLEKNEIEKCRIHLGKIRNIVNRMEGDLSSYIREVFQKANINKAFKLYEHGLSSQQTAKLLGISLWDMASYIGQSTISEAHVALTMSVDKRVKMTEDFFKMKFLIFDAGPIISLTMNGLLGVLEELKKNFNGEFIITPKVKKELIDNPLKIKKFSLEAIQVENLLKKGILRMSWDFVNNGKLEIETNRILKVANGFLKSKPTGEKITILHEGEASCLAFSNICKDECLLVVDERTTRIISEAPKNLKDLMEKKLHCGIEANLGILNSLGKFRIVRSAELIFVAYKKGLIHLGRGKDVLDALLYALKFKGTTISSQEIEDMKRMI